MAEILTPDDVTGRIEQIREMADDPEGAHAEEDALHQDVLASIAEGRAVDASELARLALTTREIRFSRWYA